MACKYRTALTFNRCSPVGLNPLPVFQSVGKSIRFPVVQIFMWHSFIYIFSGLSLSQFFLIDFDFLDEFFKSPFILGGFRGLAVLFPLKP